MMSTGKESDNSPPTKSNYSSAVQSYALGSEQLLDGSVPTPSRCPVRRSTELRQAQLPRSRRSLSAHGEASPPYSRSFSPNGYVSEAGRSPNPAIEEGGSRVSVEASSTS